MIWFHSNHGEIEWSTVYFVQLKFLPKVKSSSKAFVVYFGRPSYVHKLNYKFVFRGHYMRGTFAMTLLYHYAVRDVGCLRVWHDVNAALIVGLRPANERRRYFVTTCLIGWAQA